MINVPDMLSHLRIDNPQVAANLTVFPLIDDRACATEKPDYLTLNQGLKDGTLRIKEISRGGSVPELRVRNEAEKPVLLLDGEELVGAKQNRVPNVTILVPAGSTLIIPVSCVEAGRWAYRSDRFTTSKQAHFSSGRAHKHASVSAAYALYGERYSDQRQVWADIDDMARKLKAPSSTRAMADLFRKHDKSIEDYVQGITPQPGQVGAVFAIGNRIEGAELFDRTTTLSDLLPKLVRSFALDALNRADRVYEQPTNADAEAFLEKLASSEWSIDDAVGMGSEVRLTTDEILASGLVKGDEIVHLVAFRTPARSTGASGSRVSRSTTRRRGIMSWLRSRGNH